jgi:benzoyl-CoA reductase/2-hydroxyglutaryl-CoA dehydratase subunit BcrC/BadD/HgdB
MELPGRKVVIEQMRAQGKRIAAVLPIHSPRALLRAYGYHPVEVWGPPGVDVSTGASHFQAYTCSIVRNATSFVLGEASGLIDLVVVPHTCDALQGMGSVLKDYIKPKQPVVTLYHPRGRRPSDITYLVSELKSMAADLERHSGNHPTPADILVAVKAEEEADRITGELCRNRGAYALGDREFYTFVRSREFLPLDAYLALAAALPRGKPRRDGVPLLLGGIVPEPMAIFDRLNALGAHVVDDDLACGSRRIYQAGDNADPFVRLAHSLMSMPPDPTVGSPIPERIEHLVARMKTTGAKGMLIYDPKFCEPELFDVPMLREGLAKAGFAMLHLEYEMARTVHHQTETRIEAFVEMLQ